MAASVRKIYWFQHTYKFEKLDKNQVHSRYEQKQQIPRAFFESRCFETLPGKAFLRISSVPFLPNKLTFQHENLKPWTPRCQDPPHCWLKRKTITNDVNSEDHNWYMYHGHKDSFNP